MMHINKVNGGDFMQKENILNVPYYQKYMNKENKKRNIRLIILSIFLLALIAVAISLPFILPKRYNQGDIILVDHVFYEYYDYNYQLGQNNNEYSFFDAPIQLYGDKFIDSIYYRKIISLI